MGPTNFSTTYGIVASSSSSSSRSSVTSSYWHDDQQQAVHIIDSSCRVSSNGGVEEAAERDGAKMIKLYLGIEGRSAHINCVQCWCWLLLAVCGYCYSFIA